METDPVSETLRYKFQGDGQHAKWYSSLVAIFGQEYLDFA
jgi:hypothetical protein